MTTTAALSTEQLYAQEFLNLRLTHFKKLLLRIKKLVLEIVQYYLGTFYPFDAQACQICRDIQFAKTENDELLMVDSYKNFLSFLPIRVRAGIQGKNLFRQPTAKDLEKSHFYDNSMDKMKVANQAMFTKDETGMSPQDRLQLVDLILSDEISFDI